ncbi:E3 ubiquitin-protein ligase RNF152 [Ictidomys tridecemlineatus]
MPVSSLGGTGKAEWRPPSTGSLPLVLALPLLLRVRHGDTVPGFAAGMSDLLQLLQPPAEAQAAGLQTHLVCLQQMRTSQKDVRCPWCPGITKLPPGFFVSQLPNDPEVLAVIAIPHTSEHTRVFIKLPSNGCYMLPLPISKERTLLPGDMGCRLLPGSQQKSVTVVTIPVEQQSLQGGAPQEEVAEEQDRRGVVKSSTWLGVCMSSWWPVSWSSSWASYSTTCLAFLSASL